MTVTDQPPPKQERSLEDVMWSRVTRKRDRIHDEIKRNRAGGHRIPTWVLVVPVGVFLLYWVFLIFFD